MDRQVVTMKSIICLVKHIGLNSVYYVQFSILNGRSANSANNVI